MLGWDKSIDLKKQMKKTVILLIFLAAFPLILPQFGIDVINECSTYTISDYEAAKSNPNKTIEREDVGKCIRVAGVSAEEFNETAATDSGKKVASYFKDVYSVYAIILVALIVIIPGYNILRW